MHTLFTHLIFPNRNLTGDQSVFVDDDGTHHIRQFHKTIEDTEVYFRIDFDPNKTEPDPTGREGCRFLREGLLVADGRWVTNP